MRSKVQQEPEPEGIVKSISLWEFAEIVGRSLDRGTQAAFITCPRTRWLQLTSDCSSAV